MAKPPISLRAACIMHLTPDRVALLGDWLSANLFDDDWLIVAHGAGIADKLPENWQIRSPNIKGFLFAKALLPSFGVTRLTEWVRAWAPERAQQFADLMTLAETEVPRG